MKTLEQMAKAAWEHVGPISPSRTRCEVKYTSFTPAQLEHFAALVAERCAEALHRVQLGSQSDGYDYFHAIERAKAVVLAEFPKP